MKAKDLLAALKQLSKAELELSVYGYCDHGQSPEKISNPGVIYLKEDVHTIYDYEYTSDEEEAAENDYKYKAILL